MQESKEEFNEQYDPSIDPVFYCKDCLSLSIRGDENLSYCDKCGSTDIKSDLIVNWENLFINKYGVKYIKNGRSKILQSLDRRVSHRF